MDEEVKVTEEQEVSAMENDELKSAIEEQLSKIRRQSMLLGFQVAVKSVLDMVTEFENTPGKKSNNDHKRLIKNIEKFCKQGLSRTVNTDGETTTAEETVQN